MKMLSGLKLDLLIVIFLVLITIPLVLFFKLSFLVTTLLFFGLPAIYLLWKRPRSFKKSVFAALLFGVLYGFSFDFVAEINNAWSWFEIKPLIFPDLFLGIVSLDVMIWFFLWVLLTVLFYEYFIENDKSTKLSPNLRIGVIGGFATLLIVIALYKINPEILIFDYAYLVLGLITVFISVLILFKSKHIFHKVIKVVPFFAFLYLSFELTSLSLDHWSFPGQYIWDIRILSIQFPLEELIFWIIISSAATIIYHEFFIDDGR